MKIVKRWTTHPSLRRARTTHPPSVGYAKRRGRAQIEHLGPFGYFRLPMLVDLAIEQMKLVFEPLPVGIDHTLEVLGFVRAIARGEAIEGNTLLIAELAAVLHDIGAVKALPVHGSIEGKFQELEGPPIAREILCSLSCEGSLVDRVSFIVGNHHTFSAVDGDDFKFLWDADRIAALGHEGLASSIDSLASFARDHLFFPSSVDVALQRYFPSAS